MSEHIVPTHAEAEEKKWDRRDCLPEIGGISADRPDDFSKLEGACQIGRRSTPSDSNPLV